MGPTYRPPAPAITSSDMRYNDRWWLDLHRLRDVPPKYPFRLSVNPHPLLCPTARCPCVGPPFWSYERSGLGIVGSHYVRLAGCQSWLRILTRRQGTDVGFTTCWLVPVVPPILHACRRRVWSGAGSSSLVDEHEQVNLYPIENIMSTLNIRGKILTFLKP